MTRLSCVALAMVWLFCGFALAADKPAKDEPAFTLSPIRVQTLKAAEYFYVSVETSADAFAQAFEQGMPKLDAAAKAAAVKPVGPLVTVCADVEPGKKFVLQIGYLIETGAKPAGDARIRTLKPLKCGAAVYSGGLATYGEAVGQFMQALTAKGLVPGREFREYYLYWEGQESSNNVIMLQCEVQ